MRRVSHFALAAALGCGLAGRAAAQAPVDIITNGDFNQTTNDQGGEYYMGNGTAPVGSTQATGWYSYNTGGCSNTISCNNGYPFLFIATAGTADGNASSASTGFADPWDDNGGPGNSSTPAYRAVWGVGNGVMNGFTGYGPGGSTDTNNFLIADGGWHRTAISQDLTGLHVGDHYTVTFDWAAGQWYGNNGPTTEQWQVSLGSQVGDTKVFSNVTQGFSGWMTDSITFTATSADETLSFLAIGSPEGNPPLLLLDDVAAYDTPEPAAWSVLLVGGLGLAAAMRRRRV